MGTRKGSKIAAKEIVAIVKKHAALNTTTSPSIGDRLDKVISAVRHEASSGTENEQISMLDAKLKGRPEQAGLSNRMFVHKDIKLTANLDTEKRQYNVSEFLDYYDQTFVSLAYRILVGRYPDAQGLQHYLAKIRHGKYSRSMVLAFLRYSKEGRQNGVRLRGLFFPLSVDLAYRIPVLGYLVRCVTAVLGLPNLVRSIEQLNSNSFVYQEQSSHLFNSLSEKMEAAFINISNNPHFGQNHQNQDISRLQQQIESKADAEQLDQLQHQIDSKVEVVTMDDSLYVAFEDQFRGSSEAVIKSLSIYDEVIQEIGSLRESALAIDLGCGRGEWLKLLSDSNITGIGVDINNDMVENCRAMGLEAVKDSALDYLKATTSDSATMITGFHIIEHVSFKYLLAIFAETHRVLAAGGVAIFETPNPVNLITGSCDFYLDPTHSRPLHPKTMQFLLLQAGFSQAEIYYCQPEGLVNHTEYEFLDLNSYVNISRDYSLICHK